jgi:protein-L-isoaspartate(D-aspartate) O-methyltransferase
MMSLLDQLIQEGWLKTPRIISAFKEIKRKDFMPEGLKDLAKLNEALPIGHNQTISQPLVVAFMIELLQPKPGEKILDIGSGSGWTSALLAHIVSQEGNSKSKIRNSTKIQNSKSQNKKGKVIAIEIIPELKEFGENNAKKYNFIEKGIVEFICADGSKGYKKEAPFDKILVSAALNKKELPKAWQEQLKTGGRIVVPIFTSLWLFIKKSEDFFEEKEYPGFYFVPLVKSTDKS